jgi:hypothetical protein
MPPILIFFVLPVVLYLALAVLPRGRSALIGIAAAAALAAMATAVLAATDLSGIGLALALLSLAAVALAALVQALRRAMGPDRPAWMYPGIVIAALVVGTYPVILNLGA